MGAISSTKWKDVQYDTTDSDILSDTLVSGEGKEDSCNTLPLDAFFRDLNEGDPEEYEVLLGNDNPSTSSKIVRDPIGEKMFSPDNIKHPRSTEWWPVEIMSKFIKRWIQNLFEKSARNILKTECSRPLFEDNACLTPNLDPELITFEFKLGHDRKEGLEISLKSCEDCLPDVVGPLPRIIDTVEEAHINGLAVDINLLRGLSHRAMVLLGKTNACLNTERRRIALTKINPKLADLAEKELSENLEGLIFGEDMTLCKYLATVIAPLDKAQTNRWKVFKAGVLVGSVEGDFLTAGFHKGPNFQVTQEGHTGDCRQDQRHPSTPKEVVSNVEEDLDPVAKTLNHSDYYDFPCSYSLIKAGG
ncbi:hypothetical protein NDU88_002239 [Pleurodeles waltl]|uniref:Uncharacterized protein n=1 Tax=Pleurodeles waltl TaxID=8319 RepID=A0AAV7UV03_PLEWA|nr:hypothetical protein NDU88_002239 [Pleurodeles waltl]